MKKYFWFIAGATLALFFLGSFFSPFVLKWTEKVIDQEIIAHTLSDFLAPRVSFGLLLAFCAICAGCLLWANQKNRLVYDPKIVFGLGLLISFLTSTIGIGSKLLQYRFALSGMGNELDNIPVAATAIHYFSWGFGLTLIANGIIIALMLLLSRENQEHKEKTISVSNT
jgi:hypothetical protein